MPLCRYGAACARSDCVYRHPPPPKPAKNGGAGDRARASPEKSELETVCVHFLAGLCQYGEGCFMYHPPPEKCDAFVAQIRVKPCRYGEHCRTVGCLYSHPAPLLPSQIRGMQNPDSSLLDAEKTRWADGPFYPTRKIKEGEPIHKGSKVWDVRLEDTEESFSSSPPPPPQAPQIEVFFRSVPLPPALTESKRPLPCIPEGEAKGRGELEETAEALKLFKLLNFQRKDEDAEISDFRVVDVRFQNPSSVDYILTNFFYSRFFEAAGEEGEQEFWILTGNPSSFSSAPVLEACKVWMFQNLTENLRGRLVDVAFALEKEGGRAGFRVAVLE